MARRRAASALAACVLSSVGLVLTGCGGGGASARRPETAAPAPSEPRDVDLSRPPTLTGSDVGVEVVAVLAPRDSARIAGVLRPYLNEPVPMPERSAEAWRRNGFRVVSVPLSELSEITAKLSRASGGSLERQWLGQPVEWTEFAHAPERRRSTIIALDAERLEVSPGRARLLGRAWVGPELEVMPSAVPGPRPRAVLNVELVPQFEDAQSPGGLDALRLTEPSLNAADRGLVFDRLLARARLVEDRALVIVGEGPEVDWRTLEEPIEPAPPPARPREPEAETLEGERLLESRDDAGESAAATDGDGNIGRVTRERPAMQDSAPSPSAQRSVRRSGPEPAGPPAARVPTVGELLLNPEPEGPRLAPVAAAGEGARAVEAGGRARATRMVLILIPRVPSGFRLLPG